MLAEKKLRARFEPIRSVAKINLIRVELEDLLLGKAPLNLNREENLLELTAIRLLGREEEIARKLHSQGGGALRAAVRVDVAIGRAHSAHQIHSPITLEALVLNRNDRLPQHSRKLRVRHHNATLQGKRSKDLSMNVHQFRRSVRTIPRQVFHLRQIDGVHQHQAAHRAKDSRQPQQSGKSNTPRDPACRVVRAAQSRTTQNSLPARLDFKLWRLMFATE